MSPRRRKPRSIVILGRRWRDTLGNTYHSVTVDIDGERVVSLPFEYGYDSHYEDVTARQGLINGSHLPDLGTMETLSTYCRRKGINYACSVLDVPRKRDL